MTVHDLAPRVEEIYGAMARAMRFITQSQYAHRRGEPDVCDFAVGNPHEMPLPEFVAAVQKWAVPQNKDWYAYTINEEPARQAVAASLQTRLGISFDPEAILLTNGGFGGLVITLETVVRPGDEVIFSIPPWFFYEALIVKAGGKPVKVPIRTDDYDLDLDAIAAAITPRTRAIIVNSPHNPTGKIYPPATLQALAELLTQASARIGHPIYLISDEAYSCIVFDGHQFVSPTQFYPNSFLVYTFGKTLLTPGQRMGYIALPPEMPDQETMVNALSTILFMSTFAVPNALLQHAMEDLVDLSIDIDHLQAKRDKMVNALRKAGYELKVPEGTFYLFVNSPWPDDEAFIDMLAGEYDIFCLPGAVVEMPGTFRLSLTASDEMIDKAIPRFAAAMKRTKVQ